MRFGRDRGNYYPKVVLPHMGKGGVKKGGAGGLPMGMRRVLFIGIILL